MYSDKRGESNMQSGTVQVAADAVTLEANLDIPQNPRGIVVFAHGSGSSRHSPRNNHVARVLRDGGFATLLMDLLTSEEEYIDIRTAHLRFDINLLAERLVGAATWLKTNPAARDLAIGHFGASTGAAAALVAAAERPKDVAAVVSRGGRPDLAGPALARVQAPTLLIVGGKDAPVIDMNRGAMEQIQANKKLEIVPGATHIFEEPGALEEVARLAREWFERHLSPYPHPVR
jgi:putative phosphoribosyl transferase